MVEMNWEHSTDTALPPSAEFIVIVSLTFSITSFVALNNWSNSLLVAGAGAGVGTGVGAGAGAGAGAGDGGGDGGGVLQLEVMSPHLKLQLLGL